MKMIQNQKWHLLMDRWSLWQIIRIKSQSRAGRTHKVKSCPLPIPPIQVNIIFYFLGASFKYYAKMSQNQLIILIWQLNFSSTGDRILCHCIRPSFPERVCSKLFLLLPSLTHSSSSSEEYSCFLSFWREALPWAFLSSTPRLLRPSPFNPNWRWEVENTLDINNTAFYKTDLLLHYTKPMSIPIWKHKKTIHVCWFTVSGKCKVQP